MAADAHIGGLFIIISEYAVFGVYYIVEKYTAVKEKLFE